MVDRPVILRARICRELAARFPRGMTRGQIGQYVCHTTIPASELATLLEAMARDGLLVRGLEPRPHPREPLEVFLASDRLLGEGGGA